MDVRKRKIVLGLGNILLKDEGLGVHALHALQAALADVPEPGFQEIELLDGGTLGLSLLPIVEDASHLLVLDAVDAGCIPGTLIELEKDSISRFGNLQLSLHQLSFQQLLGLAGLRSHLPMHMHLIGAQPADVSVGLDLSPQLSAALPELVARASAVLTAWNSVK